MSLRPTQASTYELVRRGLQRNLARLARAQEEIATGKRILRPSDDAVGASVSLSLRRQAGNVGTFQHAIASVRPFLATAATELEDANGYLSEARAITLQGVNGTLDQDGRDALAHQIDLLRASLLEAANARSGDRYLFAGTATTAAPFLDEVTSGTRRVRYAGNDAEQRVLIGRGVDVAINVSGREAFDEFEYSGTTFTGPTGARHGASADSGTGWHALVVRHDATSGLGAGLVSANGGADDTIVGDHALVVDAAAGTVRLGSGEAREIPAPSAPDHADFVVTDADGSELHLDFTSWTGADFSGTVHGDASMALDGGAFVALDLSATDLELVDESTATVLHVDATGITRAGTDLVAFRGAISVFDTLQGIADDLRAGETHGSAGLAARLGERLEELDRGSRNVLSALSHVGSRMARIDQTEERLGEVDLHLKGLISKTEDVDVSSVVLDLNRAESTLQVAQAAGARLLQQSLLQYIR